MSMCEHHDCFEVATVEMLEDTGLVRHLCRPHAKRVLVADPTA
jgi:hypothetical protein